MAKFLIIRLSSIGDIVLTTPVIRCLKKQVDDAEVHFLTKKSYASVVDQNPYIDKLHLFNGNLSETIQNLKEENFDYIIDLHHNIRSLIIKLRLNVLSFSFNKLNWQKWLLVKFGVNRLPDIHIVDRYFKTLSLFDVQNDNQGLDFFIEPVNENVITTLPDPLQSGYIGIVIGAKHATKQLPIEKMIELCLLVNHPVILLGGPEDKLIGEKIVEAVGNSIFNACGNYSLQQSASLVKNARVIISNDTGLMHIAAAFKKPVLSIWGNTIPQFGMYPYLPGSESCIFEVKNLKCRPCSKLGYPLCPKEHFNCMNKQDIAEIALKANRIFNI